MNRDELKSRPEGQVRQSTNSQGIDTLYPTDQLSGGTWLGINARGIGACLLNRYGDAHLHSGSEIISRGTIVPDLLESRSLVDAYKKIDRLPLHCFRNFDLLLFSSEAILHCTHNDGSGLTRPCKNDWLMLSSSSWNPDAVLQHRQQKFTDYLATQDSATDIPRSVLSGFHLDNQGDRRFSTLMHRTTTHTKSISQIILDQENFSLRYMVNRRWSVSTKYQRLNLMTLTT
jgi:uncharacterized protein with NRDE domain